MDETEIKELLVCQWYIGYVPYLFNFEFKSVMRAKRLDCKLAYDKFCCPVKPAVKMSAPCAVSSSIFGVILQIPGVWRQLTEALDLDSQHSS